MTPLTPAVYAILLSLANGPRHGYAIMQEVGAHSGPTIISGPGTLYGTIDRMLKSGFIEETAAPPRESDERRRYYRLTSAGGRALRAEAERLESSVALAREKGVLAPAPRPART